MADLRRIGLLNENTSGHATFHRNFAQWLRSSGRFEVRVADAPPRSLLRRALTSPLPLPAGWDFDLPLFRNQLGQSVATRRMLKDLSGWADVVHMYTQNVSPLNTDLVRGKPLVLTSDGTCLQTGARFSFRYPGHGARVGSALARAVERRLVKRASLIIAQSEWARRSFIDDVGVPPDRVRTIRIGAPRPADAGVRAPDGVVRILYVGASMTRKGGYALMDALRDDLGAGLQLHLVTMDPVPPAPHVVVHSQVRPGDGKIDELLRMCDVFALPSDMDMSPNAVFEAMSYGLPVVSYRSGGIPEMVEDARSGYLADEGDIAEVRAAILRLVHDRERAADFGARGREILVERFDPESKMAEFIDALQSV